MQGKVFTYRHPVARHQCDLVLVINEPAFRPKLVCVGTKHGLITMLHPAVDRDSGLSCSVSFHVWPSTIFEEGRGWEEDHMRAFSGKNCPAMVAPPAGTHLSMGRPSGGWTLSASLITA